ncbi:MAG: energy transducer TonB [Pseudotabrizicola sp.]|uniref:energy transducer TonB family protein n=1 Tax=Pseudotabrizicola sp. TaxID=2939647 RepID=UPI00272F9F54|nr:energy transducer TonB [Pseudotabrizicola sp.]MDP2080477.1 energy transducer TonB [Pseudotabrizicola sp.]MDZ7573678.1 energy transducer TonB [Pseudotabrizicola sp.]
MSARLHAGLALALALGLHVAAFSLRPETVGAVAAGAGGDDLVSLQAADAALADLIRDWDRQPMPEAKPLADLTPPALPDTPPLLAPAPDPSPQQMPVAEALPLPQLAEAVPMADVSLPPPPLPEPDPEPELAPEHTQRPKSRPDNPATASKVAEKPKPAAKPAAKSSSAAQPAQRAAGSGGGAQAGTGGSAQSATLTKARQNDLKAGWGASIRTRIERRKSYPTGAGGASGTVTVRLTVSRAGQLAGVAVAKSSGHAALDQAAVRAVQAARSFPAAPAGLTEASYTFTLPIKFAR